MEEGSRLGPTGPVVSRRYEHGSIILTTNRHIADWGHIFQDTTPAIAILDRLLHHATVVSINGDSYRMRAHRDAIRALRPGGCPSNCVGVSRAVGLRTGS